MTMQFLESFDKYGTGTAFMLDGIWAQLSDVALGSASPAARTGTYRLEFGAALASARRVLSANETKVGVGAAWYMPDLPGFNFANCVADFRDSNNACNVSAFVTSTGAVQVYRGDGSSGGTSLGVTNPGVVTAASWNHIEVLITFSDTVGTVDVYVNNVNELSLSGVDTVATIIASCAQIIWRTGNPNNPMFMDDLYVYDGTGSHNNSQVGDIQISLQMPNGDTATANWSKSTGSSGFALIDEVPPDDAGYIFDAANTASIFDFASVPATATAIKCVQTTSRQKKSDAGTATIQVSMVSVAATATGVDNQVTTVFSGYTDIFEVDPNTSGIWSPAAVNAAQVKIARTS